MPKRQLLGPRKIKGKKFVCTDIFYRKNEAKRYAKEVRRRGEVNARILPSKSTKRKQIYGVYVRIERD